MKKAEIVYESFNMALQGSYDSFFLNNKSEEFLKDLKYNPDELQQYVQKDLKKWENTPLRDLNGLTPAEYFNGVDDFEKAVEIFKTGAVMCDDGLPDIFLDKFKVFGDKAVDALLELASDKALIESGEEDYLIPLAAVKVLGSWKIGRAAGPLIDVLLHTGNNELIMESVKDALTAIGPASIEPVLNMLERAEVMGEVHEYLLMALSQAGKSNKTDSIYKCLKNAFLKMENKVLGAICLGDYGDGRAIPALRGYLEKNRGKIDRAAFYEIKSVIQHLGGDAEDLDLHSL